MNDAHQAAAAVTIGRLNTSFAAAKILHSAVEVGVFALLDDGPADEHQIARRLDLHPKLLPDFLSALVALGLLERQDSGYRNSEQAAECLVPGGDVDLAGTVLAASARHYQTWAKLTAALRDGAPKAAGASGPEAFRTLYRDADAARRFLSHMDSAHPSIAPQLADFVPWERYRNFVDVGGARGTVAATLVRCWPHLAGTVFELPDIESLFHERMAELGTGESVSFRAGDFFVDELPPADVVILGHVLHDWTSDARGCLLDRVAAALPSGGAVVIYDQMLDEDQPDLPSLLGSLQVALVTGGAEYTIGECHELVQKAGLRPVDGRRLVSIGNDYALLAVKP